MTEKNHSHEDDTPDERKEEMEHGDADETTETEEGREKLVEDDEIEPWEAGFAEGASEDGQLGKDALTGEPLMGVEDVVEIQLNGRKYRFVNQENAEKFREKKEREKL